MGYGARIHLPAYMANKRVLVTGLADSGSGRAKQKIVETIPGARAFSNGNELASWSGIDAISVAATAAQQADIVRSAVKHGKHVLCEKPFGSSLKQISALTEAAATCGITTAVNYQFRYDAGIKRMANLLSNGEIGRILHIKVSWLVDSGLHSHRLWSWRDEETAAGGVLLDWCSHVIDYTRMLLRDSVSKIRCSTRVTAKSRLDQRGELHTVTAPDSCTLECTFSGGAVGEFLVSRVEPEGHGHRIDIYGEKGRISFHHRPPFTADKKKLWICLSGEKEIEIKIFETSLDRQIDDRLAAFSSLAEDFVVAGSGGPISPLLPQFSDFYAPANPSSSIFLSRWNPFS